MSDYLQPDFYHFSQDSIFLAKTAVLDSFEFKPKSLLDLCAGCGVVGLEMCENSDHFKRFVAVEAQKSFNPFLTENLKRIRSDISTEIIFSTLGELSLIEKFECIVTNPPYFKAGHGRRSDNQERQICRSFELDDFEILLKIIKERLCPTGRAYVVYPNKESMELKLLRANGFSELNHNGSISVYRST